MLPTGIMTLLKAGAQAGKAASSGVRPMVRQGKDISGLVKIAEMETRNLAKTQNYDGIIDLYRNLGTFDGGSDIAFQGLSIAERLKILNAIKKTTLGFKPPKGLPKKTITGAFDTLEAEFRATRPTRLSFYDETGKLEKVINPDGTKTTEFGKVVPFRPKKATGGLMTLGDYL